MNPSYFQCNGMNYGFNPYLGMNNPGINTYFGMYQDYNQGFGMNNNGANQNMGINKDYFNQYMRMNNNYVYPNMRMNNNYVNTNMRMNNSYIIPNMRVNNIYVNKNIGANQRVNQCFGMINNCINHGSGMNYIPKGNNFINNGDNNNNNQNNNTQKKIIFGNGPYKKVININFQVSTGPQKMMSAADNCPIKKLILEYGKCANYSENQIMNGLVFLYNSFKLDPNSEELVGKKIRENSTILVFDGRDILGASYNYTY